LPEACHDSLRSGDLPAPLARAFPSESVDAARGGAGLGRYGAALPATLWGVTQDPQRLCRSAQTGWSGWPSCPSCGGLCANGGATSKRDDPGWAGAVATSRKICTLLTTSPHPLLPSLSTETMQVSEWPGLNKAANEMQHSSFQKPRSPDKGLDTEAWVEFLVKCALLG